MSHFFCFLKAHKVLEKKRLLKFVELVAPEVVECGICLYDVLFYCSKQMLILSTYTVP